MSFTLWNRNVVLCFVFGALSSLCGSVLTGSFLPTYIFSLPGQTHDDVGFVSATSGIAMLLAAAPTGYVTDRFGRAVVLRWSALACAIACGTFLVALVLDRVDVLYVAAAVYGIFSGMYSAPLSTILTDSVPPKDRTRMLILNYAVQLGASACGPALASAFFLTLGDVWSTRVLRVVMIAAVAGMAASGTLLVGFSDELAHEDAEAAPLMAEDAPLLDASPKAQTHTHTHVNGEGGINSAAKSPRRARRFLCLTPQHIPYIIFASDFTVAFGAGMTVQFFSLFFANDYNLSPLLVSAIYTSTPICIALFSSLALPMGRVMGRAVAAVFWDALGTAALLCMSLPVGAAIGVPLYIVRTAAMNASYPTQRAILMDAVPKQERGKWNALESVTAFTWTGSAALGGVLIDHHDYKFTFLITGCIYVLGVTILALLIPLTAGETPDAPKDDAGGVDAEPVAAP